MVKVAVTLITALPLGAGFVLQQHAAERAPQPFFLRFAQVAGVAALVLGDVSLPTAAQIIRRPLAATSASHSPGAP